ncbi:MAG: ATP-dependent Clp protease ATP-binding subunit [Candidatus Jacksonbacteria bacterium]|nr:ATP-dependent Clp protease ATP-binding subunit [Candidatus Jacksonbacteria bacterium]
MFDKISHNVKQIMRQASLLALTEGSGELTPEHLLAGLFSYPHGLASKILNKLNLSYSLTAKIEGMHSFMPSNEPSTVKLSEDAIKLLEKAAVLAYEFRHPYIGSEHILASFFYSNNTLLDSIIDSQGVTKDVFDRHISVVLKSTSKFSEITKPFTPEEFEEKIDQQEEIKEKKSPVPALEYFANHLTHQETAKAMDPIIGRLDEIDRIIHILSRRTKSNPLLLGDPGVGKTAIIEGLAQRIAHGSVPESLQNKKVYALDMGMIVAGTMYRGEFESRLKQIIDEAKNHKNIILFIDEIHTIIGAGSASGSLDAANMLKPALARGDISCIGATTLEEYKKVFEGDAALDRRFQPIVIEEPSKEETIEVLKGLRPVYEQFHGTQILDEAITTAAELAARHIPDKFFPDKAIDLIDEACSRKKTTTPAKSLHHKILELQTRLEKNTLLKEKMIREENFTKAQAIKEKNIELSKELKRLSDKNKNTTTPLHGNVNAHDIAIVVSRISHIPVEDLEKTPTKISQTIEKELSTTIVGQNRSVKEISNVLKRNFAGLTAEHKPRSSFLFLGPSGVGKTLTAKTIAEKVYGTPSALIQIDMSEFSESFNVSKLLGAPAGYVGYKEETPFTDKVRLRPYSVILFDEIEKAHPRVFQILLQILDEGRVTDGTGRKVYFHNTSIILTSNLGGEHFNTKKIGFDNTEHTPDTNLKDIHEDVSEKVKDFFAPELLNRLDKILIFDQLTLPALEKIALQNTHTIKTQLSQMGISFSISQAALKIIAQKGYHPQYGARGVHRAVQDLVESPIANTLLSSKQKPANIKITTKGKSIIIQ